MGDVVLTFISVSFKRLTICKALSNCWGAERQPVAAILFMGFRWPTWPPPGALLFPPQPPPRYLSRMVERCLVGQSSRIVVLDPSAAEVVRAVAPSASTPPETAAGVAFSVARAHEEQDSAYEQGSPRAPTETKGVAADAGRAVVSQEGVTGLDEGGCHQRNGNGVEEQGCQCHEPGDGCAEAATAGEEAREEGEHVEEQRDEVEDPAKPPHVEVVLGGRVASEAPVIFISCCPALCTIAARGRHSPAQPVWNIIGIIRPSVAERHGGARSGAVDVAGAADVEVGPLRDAARTGDARRVCPQEVGILEG